MASLSFFEPPPLSTQPSGLQLREFHAEGLATNERGISSQLFAHRLSYSWSGRPFLEAYMHCGSFLLPDVTLLPPHPADKMQFAVTVRGAGTKAQT